MIKILIGGSPCTKWSCAQKNNRETEAEGIGWELFKNYLTAKEKFQPDFFLYENNKSAAPAIKDQIAKELGVGTDLNARFTYINSALVSAQNRQRFYVTNCGDIEQPKDRGILLKDILESGVSCRNEKAYCLDANYYRGGNRTHFNKQSGQRLMCAEPLCVAQRGRYVGENKDINQVFEARVDGKTNTLTTVSKDNNIAEPVEHGNPRYLLKNFKTESEKANTLTASCYKGIGSDGMITVSEPICMRYERSDEAKAVRRQYEAGEVHYGFNELRELHPRTDGKTNTLTTVLKDNPICKPVILNYELAELSDEYYHGNDNSTLFGKIVCNDSSNNKGQPAQGTRVYQTDGKCICLDADSRKYIIDKVYATPIEFDGDVPIKAISNADNKTYPVYCVKDGQITIKEKQYPIKLEDGYYIIRKLTVTEAARLQTMPDDYCRAVSASQSYKGLGNGWTAEVIIHLLQHMNIPLDEEIVVLSMYDGIGTGRYCLDKMGYKNVKYYATEIDKYAMQVSMSNCPDIVQLGDAFQVREDDWCLHEY